MRGSLPASSSTRTSYLRRAVLAGLVALSLAAVVHDGRAMESTAPLAAARDSHSAAALPDGRVLVAGGNDSMGTNVHTLASTEIYDPVSRSYSAAAPMNVSRSGHLSAVLADGRVLVAGGRSTDTGGWDIASAEIYDPATNTWSVTGALQETRRLGEAVTLLDGHVLMVGGDPGLNSSEIYDPASGSFGASAVLLTPRGRPAIARLADGRVLMAGGFDASTGGYLSSVEIYDPSTGNWSYTGSLLAARAYATATLLTDGKVLIAGGNTNSSFPAAAELYDPVSGTFSASGALNVPRQSHVATRLASGDVLISGGTASTWQTEDSSEIYAAASGSWYRAGRLNGARNGHTQTLLGNGDVLVAAGWPGPTANSETIDVDCAVATNTVTPTSQSFASAGGSNSFAMSVPANCSWSVNRVPPWMTIDANAHATGPATVSYSVAPMTTGGTRSTTLLIAGKELVVSQIGTCNPNYSAYLSPASRSFTTSGGSGTVSVSHDAACSWSVAGVPAWITITAGASGQGNGTVSYSVAANTGPARSATLTIGNSSVVVSQTGAVTCDPGAVATLTPTSQNLTSVGGSSSISVTHGAACSWTVSGAPAWITINSGASGTGNGTVVYTATVNTGTARSATLSVAGKSFVVNQAAPAGAACDPLNLVAGVTASGSLASGDCTQGARGSSYYTDRYSFTATAGQKVSLQLSSSAFDSFIYLKNASGTVLTSNDDGGGGTNSRIPATSGYYTLTTAGTYTVEVTSYASGKTGAYTLLRTDY